MKLTMLNIMSLIMIYLFNMIYMKMLNFNNNIMMYTNNGNYMMMKMYIIPSGMMTLIITIYLLFVLIIVINILTMNMLTFEEDYNV